jgi:hypothetical protein
MLNRFRHLRPYPPDWLLILLLIVGVFLWQRTSFPLWMVDLLPFQVASYHWVSDHPEWIYTSAERINEWQEQSKPISDSLGGEGFGNPYYYPPYVAALLAPFAELPADYWRKALFAVNFLLIFVNAWLISRLCEIRFTWRAFLWALVVPLMAYPLSRATKLGQFVPILAVMVWLGILWARDKQWWRSGIILAMAGAAKLFPIGLVFVPLITRRWKLVSIWLGSAAVIYGVSILLLGMKLHILWYESVREFGILVYNYWGNQSLIGWYSRLFREYDLIKFTQYSDAGIVIARNTITMIIGGGTALFIWLQRVHITERTMPLYMGFFFAGILLSIANAWEHYWLFCLPVLGWAIRDVWNEGKLGFSQLWMAGTAFFYLMKLTRFYMDSSFGRIATGSQTVGMLMLWLWLIWRLKRGELKAIEA